MKLNITFLLMLSFFFMLPHKSYAETYEAKESYLRNLYGDKIIDYLFQESYSSADVMSCLLYDQAQNIWGADELVIVDAASSVRKTDQKDPYKDHLLIKRYTERDKNGYSEDKIHILVKQAVLELLKEAGVFKVHNLQVLTYEEAVKKERETATPRYLETKPVIKLVVMSKPSNALLNTSMMNLHFVFYGPHNYRTSLPQNEVSMEIDLSNPQYADKKFLVKTIKEHIDGAIPRTCINKLPSHDEGF